MKKVYFLVLLIGILILTFTAYLVVNKYSFVNSTEKTVATVIDNKISYSKNSGGKSSRFYFPILTFVDRQGKAVTFMSSVGSTIPSYQIGDRVEILYDAAQPSKAEVSDFKSIWLAPIIIGIIGIVFFAIGFIPFLLRYKTNKFKKQMLNNGRRIEATIESIDVNSSFAVNGRSPYVIYSQWVDKLCPDTIYVFESENIWFNPKPYINRETITVFIDENNPHRYYVDIGFLPKIK